MCVSTDIIFIQNKATEQNPLEKLIVVHLVKEFAVSYGTAYIKKTMNFPLIAALAYVNPLFMN